MTDDPIDFATLLTEHARGTVNEEMTAALTDLVSAVAPTGKKGTITLEVGVAPIGAGGRTVQVAMRVKSKLPDADPEAGVFFVDRTGMLRRSDPFTEPLPFAELPVEPPEHVTIDHDTGEIVDVADKEN